MKVTSSTLLKKSDLHFKLDIVNGWSLTYGKIIDQRFETFTVYIKKKYKNLKII